MKIGICDDNEKELLQIFNLLKEYDKDNDFQIYSFNSSIEIINSEIDFDICFLDIVMPNYNGIELGGILMKENKDLQIIYLTSSAEYAVDAFAVGAVHYLVKPANIDEIKIAMERVALRMKREEKLSIIKKTTGGIRKIIIKDIMYIENIGHYVCIFLNSNDTIQIYGKISDLYQELCEITESFCYPHRGFVINMEYISNITTKTILLKNKVEIPISRNKTKEIKQQYVEHFF